FRVLVVVVDVAGPHGLAPDVDLAAVAAPHKDTAVSSVGELALQILPLVVAGIKPIRGEDRQRARLGLFGQTPIGDHDEIAVLFLGPQIPGLGSSGVRSSGGREDAILDDPMSRVFSKKLPTRER